MRTYEGFTKDKLTAVVGQMLGAGMGIDGTNPWKIDTRTHNILLDASWDGSSLFVSVADKPWYVSESQIWDRVEPLILAARGSA